MHEFIFALFYCKIAIVAIWLSDHTMLKLIYHFIYFKKKKKRQREEDTCAGSGMLEAGVVLVIAGGLSLELRARFKSCV
jgi:hypothetical protein